MNTNEKMQANKNLLELLIDGASNICAEEGVEDIDVRNAYAGMFLAILEKSIKNELLILTDDYSNDRDEDRFIEYVELVKNNKNLRLEIMKIIKVIFEDNIQLATKLSVHFIETLPFLLRSEIIKIK